MQGSESLGSIGVPTFLMSDDRQHKPEQWADTIARQIFDATALDADRKIEAEFIQFVIADILEPYINDAIALERERLKQRIDHCVSEYDILHFVDRAITDIQKLPSHDWSELLVSEPWVRAAKQAIGNIMATVLHVERLWFADDHPDNVVAQNYKLRFQGNN